MGQLAEGGGGRQGKQGERREAPCWKQEDEEDEEEAHTQTQMKGFQLPGFWEVTNDRYAESRLHAADWFLPQNPKKAACSLFLKGSNR